MSDERILGDSGFVDTVLSEAKEAYERKYELKRRGYDVERIAKRVAEIYGVEAEEVFSKGRQQKKVRAGAFCAIGLSGRRRYRSGNWRSD